MKRRLTCRLLTLALGPSLLLALAGTSASGQSRLPDGVPPDLTFEGYLGDTDTFGIVTSARFLGGDHLVVLDARTPQIVAFDSSLNHVGQLGSRGRGPGEFFQATALAAYGDRFYVLDRGNLRIMSGTVRAGRIEMAGEQRVPIPSPRDLCVLRGQVYVLGLLRGHLVHRLAPDATVAQSFLPVAQSDPTRGQLASVARIACSDEMGAIAVVGTRSGTVDIITLDGSGAVTGTVPGFRAQEFDFSGGAMRPLPPAHGFHHAASAVAWLPEGHLFIQVVRTGEAALDLHESYVFDIESGDWAETPYRWPLLLDFRAGEALFEEEAPVPLVGVYRAR